MNYLSPYIILDASSQGIINASFILFGVLFISALFLGRLWCAWLCPGGGMGEVCFPIQNKPVNLKKTDWIKWAIWLPWLGLIIFLAIQAGGYHTINLLHLTESGISVSQPMAYIIYYIVVGLFVTLALLVGRRAGCHTICWMAPFMILGRKLRNLFAWPSVRLIAIPQNCTSCQKCTRNCPMSLDVTNMVKSGNMEHSECILCANCVDGCPSKAILFTFQSGK
jgi:polyferredoxin